MRLQGFEGHCILWPMSLCSFQPPKAPLGSQDDPQFLPTTGQVSPHSPPSLLPTSCSQNLGQTMQRPPPIPLLGCHSPPVLSLLFACLFFLERATSNVNPLGKPPGSPGDPIAPASVSSYPFVQTSCDNFSFILLYQTLKAVTLSESFLHPPQLAESLVNHGHLEYLWNE